MLNYAVGFYFVFFVFTLGGLVMFDMQFGTQIADWDLAMILAGVELVLFYLVALTGAKKKVKIDPVDSSKL